MKITVIILAPGGYAESREIEMLPGATRVALCACRVDEPPCGRNEVGDITLPAHVLEYLAVLESTKECPP